MKQTDINELKRHLTPDDLSLILASRLRHLFNTWDMSINEWRQLSAALIGTGMVTADTMFDIDHFTRVDQLRPLAPEGGQA